MTPREAANALIIYWLGSAKDALASADSEHSAGRYRFAMNRAYYACFYAAIALLLSQGKRFVKHSGVRSAVHRELVRSGILCLEYGQAYDLLFDARQRADYAEIVQFDPEETRQAIAQARSLVSTVGTLLNLSIT